MENIEDIQQSLHISKYSQQIPRLSKIKVESNSDRLFQGLVVGGLLIIIYHAFQLLQAWWKNHKKPVISKPKRIPVSEQIQSKINQIQNLKEKEQVKLSQNVQSDNQFASKSTQQESNNILSRQEIVAPQQIKETIPSPQKKQTKREKIKQDLMAMIKAQYETRTTAPTMSDVKEKQLILRRRQFEEGTPDQFLLEQTVIGVMPHQFFQTFRKVYETQHIWNQHLKSCELFDKDGDTEIIITIFKSPALFVASRIVMDGVYLNEDKEKNEYMSIFSSIGNEDYWEDYVRQNDVSDYAVAKSVISGHWFKPLYNPQNETEIIGTSVFYLNQADLGGNIPTWLKTTFAPKAIVDGWESLAAYCQKNPK